MFNLPSSEISADYLMSKGIGVVSPKKKVRAMTGYKGVRLLPERRQLPNLDDVTSTARTVIGELPATFRRRSRRWSSRPRYSVQVFAYSGRLQAAVFEHLNRLQIRHCSIP